MYPQHTHIWTHLHTRTYVHVSSTDTYIYKYTTIILEEKHPFQLQHWFHGQTCDTTNHVGQHRSKYSCLGGWSLPTSDGRKHGQLYESLMQPKQGGHTGLGKVADSYWWSQSRTQVTRRVVACIMSHENTLSSVYIADMNSAVPYKEKIKAEKETVGL